MKKIAIDNFPLYSGHAARGMGVYTRNLIENIKDSREYDLIIRDFNFAQNHKALSSYDLVHYPYFDIFYHTLPVFKRSKTIVTIPDVTPLLFPKYYPPGFRGKINHILQRVALANVDAVITISETSKSDISKFLNFPPEKIFVTPLASNFRFIKSRPQELNRIREKYKLPKKFVLYIGDVNWNKNLLRLIKATKSIDTTLVIVGKSAVNTNYDHTHIENVPLLKIQKSFGDDKQIMRLGFIEDKELNAIWQLAGVYCMPSLYEGFGLSVLEAMEAGVPVACSSTPALVETAGEAALYFDPKNTNDMAKKISKILADSKLANALILKGKERAKNYSWKITAKKTIDVYLKCLGSFV